MHFCIWNSTCFLWSYQVSPLVLDLYHRKEKRNTWIHLEVSGQQEHVVVWTCLHHWGLSATGHIYTKWPSCTCTCLDWKDSVLLWHVYTKGAWAAPERVCLHYRVICCTWGYQQNRRLTCTWTCLDNRSLCWSWHVYIIGALAAPWHVYTTKAFAAPRRVNKTAA